MDGNLVYVQLLRRMVCEDMFIEAPNGRLPLWSHLGHLLLETMPWENPCSSLTAPQRVSY